MSSPEKTAATPESTTNPSLPDDLFLSCVACLSRLYYPTLSLVSKRLPPLLASPELYISRSLLNRTESCLYVCLRFPPDPNPRLFTLCQKPDTRNLLIPIPTLQSSSSSSPVQWSEFVAVDSNIYSFGGGKTRISILDCRSHMWREAPSMRFERLDLSSSACVIDGKIYVVGADENSIEVFDTKTQIWDLVTCPLSHKRISRCKSVGIEGKLHLLSDGQGQGVVYDPKTGEWDLVEREMDDKDWLWVPYCVIDNVLYCYYDEELLWYDTKLRSWKSLKGIVGLPVFPDYRCPKLVDYGGKMAVLWVEYLCFDGGDNKTMISCAEILIEKRGVGDEIWGQVEWIDNVLTISGSCNLFDVLAITI